MDLMNFEEKKALTQTSFFDHPEKSIVLEFNRI